ncbi:hypothetical protein [Streptomyces albipurpureus]|uniref:Uncharacterized protein n=1 Tax=Streptomyces albipurpureus TaxID=2897419 RepID=A0ABT0UZL2_9ACTN|nr:hypothetical protein [Streptomyces sp. CWNU-1]MCM2392591.1 hypothetical protein [Streptomyces sp. CWNU-1]
MAFGKRTDLVPGVVFIIRLPFSEVCTHMQVAGKVMGAEIVEDGRAVQLYDGNGNRFSVPITTNEAGIGTSLGTGEMWSDSVFATHVFHSWTAARGKFYVYVDGRRLSGTVTSRYEEALDEAKYHRERGRQTDVRYVRVKECYQMERGGTGWFQAAPIEDEPKISTLFKARGANAPLDEQWTVERPFQSYGTEQRTLAAGRTLAHHYGYGWAVRDTYMIPKFDDVQIFAGRYMIGEF